MTAGSILLVVLALALGYANGSNDISKGIATLVGTGVADRRVAVAWGAVWTAAGALVAAFASQGLVGTFSGSGFLEKPADGGVFLAAVAAGAIAWVLFASRTGLPVSTTHAIIGALAGAGILLRGVSGLRWSFLAEKVALPLLLSPLMAVALLYAIFPLLRRSLARLEGYCVCVERAISISPSGSTAMASLSEASMVARQEECTSPAIAGRLNVVDGLHWVSSALASLARGLNDTPKIVALGIAAAAVFHVSGFPFYAAVAVSMAAGSLVAGLRVTETLACRVTTMSHTEGFAANLVTAALVGIASLNSLPVSTTHVSTGAILGLGLHRGGESLRWKTVRDIALAWLVTLPVAGLVAAGIFALLR